MTRKLRDYAAARELNFMEAEGCLEPFGHVRFTRLNQHAGLFEFLDGSRMKVSETTRRVDCWHPGWQGKAHDIHLGPIKGASIPQRP